MGSKLGSATFLVIFGPLVNLEHIVLPVVLCTIPFYKDDCPGVENVCEFLES